MCQAVSCVTEPSPNHVHCDRNIISHSGKIGVRLSLAYEIAIRPWWASFGIRFLLLEDYDGFYVRVGITKYSLRGDREHLCCLHKYFLGALRLGRYNNCTVIVYTFSTEEIIN